MALINNVKVVPDLEGWLLLDFDDHTRKLVNINPYMDGVLAKLKDQTFFAEVFVDEELQTVSWPGELDLDPDNLYENGIDVEMVKDLVQAVKNKDGFSNFIEKQTAY
ncbi:DUF2442 domain-containing protein [Virgibacillus natechei]